MVRPWKGRGTVAHLRNGGQVQHGTNDFPYEKLRCPFDPRRNIALLPVKEIRKEHYTREYLRFCTLVRDRYLYEFMRLGTEVTPFNTL